MAPPPSAPIEEVRGIVDAVTLARIQFGVTAGFHFLFPPLTLGLSLVVLILETMRLRRPDGPLAPVSAFLVRLLGVVFVMGAATGITLEFAFGANWSAYSKAVGDIFGAPLAAEGVFAFFTESTFLGILVFGRGRVSRRLYWAAAALVFAASHLSAFFIVAANSWMQTPAGFVWREGRAVLDGLGRALFNPSTGVRVVHVILGGWIAGGLAAAAIAAGLLRRGRNPAGARTLLRASFALFAAASIVQLGSGHAHSVEVANHQPAKMAAFEALWTSGPGAPFTVFGLPDAKARETRMAVRIPGMLSFLVGFDTDTPISGLDAFPPSDHPPILATFAAYHLMVLAGLALIALAVAGGVRLARGRLDSASTVLRLLPFAVPLPFAANLLGWMAAELGRQPWVVQGLLRTADAASPVVSAGAVLTSLILLSLLYVVVAVGGGAIIAGLIRTGPAAEPAEPALEPVAVPAATGETGGA